MRPLVESIHSLRLTHVDDHGHDRLPSHGPAVAVRDRLLVSDPDGRMFDVVGLPHQPVLVLYGDLGYNFSPDLSSFSRNAAQTHALAKAWCRQTRCFVFRLFSEEKRTWTTLAAPPPGCDGAPLTDAVLGAWVGDEIVVFSVRPRFGRILPEALFWSRYNRDGEMANNCCWPPREGGGRSRNGTCSGQRLRVIVSSRTHGTGFLHSMVRALPSCPRHEGLARYRPTLRPGSAIEASCCSPIRMLMTRHSFTTSI